MGRGAGGTTRRGAGTGGRITGAGVRGATVRGGAGTAGGATVGGGAGLLAGSLGDGEGLPVTGTDGTV